MFQSDSINSLWLIVNIAESEDYDDEADPQLILNNFGELEPEFPDYEDYEAMHLCAYERMADDFKVQLGTSGRQLYEAIVELDITDVRHSVAMHGRLLYYMTAYLTYKNKLVGTNITNKTFNSFVFKELFPCPKTANDKVQQFVSFTP